MSRERVDPDLTDVEGPDRIDYLVVSCRKCNEQIYFYRGEPGLSAMPQEVEQQAFTLAYKHVKKRGKNHKVVISCSRYTVD